MLKKICLIVFATLFVTAALGFGIVTVANAKGGGHGGGMVEAMEEATMVEVTTVGAVIMAART